MQALRHRHTNARADTFGEYPVHTFPVGLALTLLCLWQCRCNPDWTSLPRYSKVLLDETATTSSSCPCGVNPKARSKNRTSQEIRDSYARVFNGLERIPSRKSSDSVSMVESSPINQATMPSLRNRDSLYERSTQFERLISGQESEIGEAPPAYDVVARSTTVR
jgi:hypothetical protein